MASENYGELYAAAIAESGLGSEVLPDGPYNVKIATVKADPPAAGKKLRVGFRLQVEDGPFKGVSTWVNQTFSPENPKAVAVFLRLLKELGGPAVAGGIAQGQAPDVLCQYVVQGSLGTAVLGSHTYGTNDDGTPRRYQDLKSFSLSAGAAPVSAVPAPAAAAATPVQEVAHATPVLVATTVPANGTIPAPF